MKGKKRASRKLDEKEKEAVRFALEKRTVEKQPEVVMAGKKGLKWSGEKKGEKVSGKVTMACYHRLMFFKIPIIGRTSLTA